MNETEIRSRLRRAIGEVEYPPLLTGHVTARLDQPATHTMPRGLGVVAAVLAILIVAGLVFVRAGAPRLERPAAIPPASASPAPPMVAALEVPAADLAAGGLTAGVGVMTDPNLVSTNSGRTVRLVGAYADTSRTVLVLRTLPAADPGRVEITDGRGMINAGEAVARGSIGDDVVTVYQAPAHGPDGMANLKVTIAFFTAGPPAAGTLSNGNWSFAFPLKVQGATPLALQPLPTTVGAWKVAVEVFELTPSAIHLRLTVTGASADAAASAVKLVDSAGNEVFPAGSSLTPVGGSLRLDYTWPRAIASAGYRLSISGGGGQYSAGFSVPASAPLPGGLPKLPGPYDVPSAQESMRLDGAMTEQVDIGHPQECRAVTDPGGTSFVFATYFRSQSGAWYYLSFVTDLADRSYAGPGLYGARAYISPLATNGPADQVFSGTAQLTVATDSGLRSGVVQATLHWNDDAKQQVTVSGGWTCRDSVGAA